MITNRYYAEFAGELFVIQAEAEAVENVPTMCTILGGIRDLLSHGIRVALVFGKGVEFTQELFRRFGAREHSETNRLIVPEHALPRMQEQRGSSAQTLASCCESLQIPFSLLPETAIRAERRIGHESTGIVTEFDLPAIRAVLDDLRLAILGFGGWDEHQQFLHVPSVSLAADLAVELNAHKLLLLTHTDGIFVPSRKGALQQLSFADLEELLCVLPRRDAGGSPLLPQAILPKVHASIRAVAGGVRQVHIVSYSRMLEEILTRTGVGTMIERQQSHHVDYARPEDLDEIDRLHQESQRYVTVCGTPFVKPLDRAGLERLLPHTLVLSHRDILIGKLHVIEVAEAPHTRLISGFVIGENHQDSQHGQLLLTETLGRLRGKGIQTAAAITASNHAKRLFQRNGGIVAASGGWQMQHLAQSRQRYHPDERETVELFEFPL
jgi:acetylglutamate kinase